MTPDPGHVELYRCACGIEHRYRFETETGLDAADAWAYTDWPTPTHCRCGRLLPHVCPECVEDAEQLRLIAQGADE
jgi:hypothetical protein